MRIISFDPSSTKNLGYAVVSTLNTEEDVSVELIAGTFVLQGTNAERWTLLWVLFQLVDVFMAENQPDVVVLEQTGSFSSGFITSQIANCIGVILSVCGKHNVPVRYLYPTHVKKVITGKGKATKSVMKKSVIEHLKKLNVESVKYDSEHAYDALANALCFMHECEDINFKID